jgi:DNA-binding transcriptional LysR family regulator
MQKVVCASPEYARRHGLPASIDEIAAHACVNQRLANGRLREWTFRIDGKTRSVTPEASLTLNDASLMLDAVLAGEAIGQLPAYLVCEALRGGRLVACLEAFSPDDGGHYLCYLSRRQLPKRIRAFVDFMTEEVRALDLDCTDLPTHSPHAGLVRVAAAA